MRTTLAIFVALIGMVAIARAQTAEKTLSSDGNTFLSECGNYETDSVACAMYVGGLVDGMELIFQTSPGLKSRRATLFCFPSQATNGQELQVVIQFIKTHPAEAHRRTSVLIFAATMDAFRCPAKEKP
jgi:hypothetical protein